MYRTEYQVKSTGERELSCFFDKKKHAVALKRALKKERGMISVVIIKRVYVYDYIWDEKVVR